MRRPAWLKHGNCVQCNRYVLTPYKLWCGIKCQIAWEKLRGTK